MNKEDSIDSLKFYVKQKQIDEMREYTQDYGREQFVYMLVEQREEIFDLQQQLSQRDEDIRFCLQSIKQEMKMSIDERTKKEMEVCYEILKQYESSENEIVENRYIKALNGIREYITSYESISTIQGLDNIEKNKLLDDKTMIEMTNRYLKVHDDILQIINKSLGEENVPKD